jgi:hypothetical protein
MPAKRRSFVGVVSATERALRAARVEQVFVGALAVSAFGSEPPFWFPCRRPCLHIHLEVIGDDWTP